MVGFVLVIVVPINVFYATPPVDLPDDSFFWDLTKKTGIDGINNF